MEGPSIEFRRHGGQKSAAKVRGFTLIELMIVVALVGILSALAAYGVSRYVEQAKSTEARELLGRICQDHLVAFEGERATSSVLPFGGSTGIPRSLCPDATAHPLGIGTLSAPVSHPAIRSAKWQPSPADFQDSGWACLKFSVSTPLYYGYGMDSNQAGQTAAVGDTFSAFAIGDLDGDEEPSMFEIGGQVASTSSGNTALVLAAAIRQARAE